VAGGSGDTLRLLSIAVRGIGSAAAATRGLSGNEERTCCVGDVLRAAVSTPAAVCTVYTYIHRTHAAHKLHNDYTYRRACRAVAAA
jgi:hypothetical protein